MIKTRSRATRRRSGVGGRLQKDLLTTGAVSLMVSSLALAASPSSEAPEHIRWRDTMVNMETPHEGCFQAAFPSTLWESVPCRTLSAHTHPLHRTESSGEGQTTGDGKDYVLLAPGLISKTIGSFPSVVGVTSESSVGVPAFGDGGILGANEYSLQINTNDNATTSACSHGVSGCKVWQQFIYATDYETRGSAAVFMQYWLLGYGASCPSGYHSSGTDCYTNSSYVAAPDVPITGLGSLKITGGAIAGGNDSVTFADGATAYSVSAADSVLQIGTVWKESEFNVVGDAGGSEAVFNAGATLTVNASAQFGSTSAPTCASNAGTTGESNNLPLGYCVAAGGTTPSIQFTEGAVVETCPSTVVTVHTRYGTDVSTGCQTTFSPATLLGGLSVSGLVDIKYALGTTLYSQLDVSGFSNDPGSAWLVSVSAEGVTKTSAAASSYSFDQGTATWFWEGQFGFPSSGSVTATITHQ